MSITTFSTLPNDIIYELTKYISLKDIAHLKLQSTVVNEKVKNLQKHIIVYNINQTQECNGNTIDNLYDYLNSYLSECIKKYRRIFFKEFYWSKHLYNEKFFKYYISDFDNFYYFADMSIVNKIFIKIFRFYVTNDFCDVRSYPNSLELLGFYNFIKIQKRDVYNIDYYHNFFESLSNKLYYDIKIDYYKYVLDLNHGNVITTSFNSIYKISKYITSVLNVKRLMSYKVLDLSKSILNMCCEECGGNNVYEICVMKRNFYKDDLISHNYNELKKILRNENPYYYTELTTSEDVLINNMIYIKDPYTNRRIRLNGYRFKGLMENLKEEAPVYHIKIEKMIKHQREFFRNKFFT